jgi:hypothetical protein
VFRRQAKYNEFGGWGERHLRRERAFFTPASASKDGAGMGVNARSLEIRRLIPPFQGRNRSAQLAMTDDLTNKIVAWATEIARYGAALPSRERRENYLAERHRELAAGAMAEGAGEGDALVLADTCVNAARRIMTELLAQRAGVPHGRA